VTAAPVKVALSSLPQRGEAAHASGWAVVLAQSCTPAVGGRGLVLGFGGASSSP
jgi:hypothetical protein